MAMVVTAVGTAVHALACLGGNAEDATAKCNVIVRHAKMVVNAEPADMDAQVAAMVAQITEVIEHEERVLLQELATGENAIAACKEVLARAKAAWAEAQTNMNVAPATGDNTQNEVLSHVQTAAVQLATVECVLVDLAIVGIQSADSDFCRRNPRCLHAHTLTDPDLNAFLGIRTTNIPSAHFPKQIL